MTSLPATPLRERVPRIAEAAVERARLTVVPRPRRVRAPRVPFVTLVSVMLVGGVVGLLCFNTQMQQASFAATSLQEQATNLTAREQTLHDELEALRDPQHVATLAQHRGMVIPETSCILRLSAERAANTCTPATPANTPTLLGRPPTVPAFLDPAPHVVVVPAAEPATGSQSNKPNKPNQPNKPDRPGRR